MERILRYLTLTPVQQVRSESRRAVLMGQAPFTATVFLLTVIHPEPLAVLPFQLGVALAAVLLAGGVIVPWERFSRPLYLAIPLLDFVAVGLLQMGGSFEVFHLGLLTVFPVVWLASSAGFPRWCMLASILGTLAIAWEPVLLQREDIGLGNAAHELSRVLPLPLVMLALAATVRLMVDNMAAKDEKLRSLLAETDKRERLLRTIMDTVGTGVLAVDAQGQEILSNRQQRYFQQLARTTGNASRNEERHLLFEFGSNVPLPVDQWPSRRAARGESMSDQLCTVGDKPGQRVLSSSIRYVRNAAGTVDGAVIASSDVTELINAIDARDDFMANVSHELKTPLTVILGNTELLLDDAPPAHRTRLEAVERNAVHLLHLVQDLLDSAKRTAICPVPTNVSELIAHSATDAGHRADPKGITIRTEVQPDLLLVCDPLRVRQVLDNLISNAIKYSPEDSTVVIRARQEDGYLVCRIVDQGRGMNAHEMGEAFTRFYRSPSVRKTAIPGMGLGLPIAKAIVEQHGGNIGFESTPAQGTVVSFTLPLHRELPADSRVE